MKSSFGVHCFCYACGTGWAEYVLPAQCITCNETILLGYSRVINNQDMYIGAVWSTKTNEKQQLYMEQSVNEESLFRTYRVPLPKSLYTLDSFVFDWDTGDVLDLNGERLCTLVFYLEEVLELT